MTCPQVLCIGEGLWDCIADHPADRVEQVQSWTRCLGGAPVNVACTLQQLGTSTGFVGGVGTDPLGQDLSAQLTALGVDLVGVQPHPTTPTREVYVLQDASGERVFAGFSEADPACFADAHLQAEALPKALFAEADYLVLGTVALAYPETRAAIAQVLQWVDEFYLKVILDLNWRPSFWLHPEEAPGAIAPLLEQSDILKLSVDEAQWLFQTSDVQVIYDQHPHLEGVILTQGAAGCTYCFHQRVGAIPAFAVPAIETTGAGDAFVAGFVHQLCQQGIASLQNHHSLQAHLRYASAVAALSTLQPGAITTDLTPAKVEAFLAQHP